MKAPHWIETGRGERVLVFLHGISGGAAGALDILPLLTPPGWRGLAWDMPGYGKSRQVEPVNFDSFAGALVDLFDAAGLEQAVLVGHSMGGMIALQAAVRFPERISGLVLACCTPAFGAPAGPLQQAFLARRLGPLDEGATMRELAVELIPTMVGPGADPVVVRDAVDLMGRIAPASYRAAMHALLGFDQRAALPGLKPPLMVLLPGDSPFVSTAMYADLPVWLPGARLHGFPGVRHGLPFSHGRQCALLLQDFIASQGPA